METIRTILVTTDFSETSQAAFGVARQLAEKFGAKMILLHVQELNLPPFVVEHAGIGIEEIERRHGEQDRKILERMALQLGADTETKVASGTPHLEIVRLAKELDADLVVMATHGRGFFSHAILGSTTERVIRRASCPVLVVRDRALTDERS